MGSFLFGEMSFVNITIVDAMDEGEYLGCFVENVFLKAPVQNPFDGRKPPVEVGKRVKEEWKRWRKRGEKERGGLKGL